MVDDNPTSVAPIAEAIRTRLDHSVTLLDDVASVTPQVCVADPFDLAMVDLSFRGNTLSGLDVLVTLSSASPATHLMLFTQGDDAVADLMRDTWEALPLACAISKSLPLERLVETVRLVLRDGTAPVDPVLQPLLPLQRSPWRAAGAFGRLVHHAGHAKLWNALIHSGPDPSYEDLHRLSGLKINTLRNYREQLLAELSLHGLEGPTIRQMRSFACRCRPLLAPFLDRALAASRGGVTGPSHGTGPVQIAPG